MNIRKISPALLAATAAVAVLVPSAASAAPAAHHSGIEVRVLFRNHGRAEVVVIVRDPHQVKVTAVGNCQSTGFANETGRAVDAKGERSRITCPHAAWFSVGWASWHGWRGDYHAVRGSANLFG